MFSPLAFVQDGCLTTFLPTSALVRLYFRQSDGREVVSHLHLHFLSMRSSLLSCSWAIWVSSGQIASVRILGYLLQPLLQESPTRCDLSQKGILLAHVTRSTGVSSLRGSQTRFFPSSYQTLLTRGLASQVGPSRSKTAGSAPSVPRGQQCLEAEESEWFPSVSSKGPTGDLPSRLGEHRCMHVHTYSSLIRGTESSCYLNQSLST